MDCESRGALLVAGDDDRVLAAARALAPRLKVVAFAPGIAAAPAEPFTAVAGRVVALAGRLGRFRAGAAGSQGEVVDIGVASPNADGFFDLVLDLGSAALLDAPSPSGYFAAHDPVLLAAALDALPRLVGSFPQPRPGRVRIRASACTLCGACANDCPTGALRLTAAGSRQLWFLEAACVQCGRCTAACPEKAVALHSRPLDRGAARPVVLAQSRLMRCIGCGQPYAAQALDQRGLARAMPAAARSALQRCPTCRARALFAEFQ